MITKRFLPLEIWELRRAAERQVARLAGLPASNRRDQRIARLVSALGRLRVDV